MLSSSGSKFNTVPSNLAFHPKSYETGSPIPSLGVMVNVPLPLHSGVIPTS
jgi:hypothetical protein